MQAAGTRLALSVVLVLVPIGSVSCVSRETHNIPAGYMGDVFIIHGASDGEPLRETLFSTVYDIPANGILRSSTLLDRRMFTARYYYVHPDGSRKRITAYWPSSIHDTPENRSDDTIGIWFRRSGNIGAIDDPCPVRYQQYYVGTKVYLLDREPVYPLHEYLKNNPIPCKTQDGQITSG